MAFITRTYTFTDGTTAYGSQVDSEIANIVNTLNNVDTGATKWDVLSVLNGSTVPLTVDNSTGSQDVADFKVNGTTKVSIGSAGLLTASNGATVSGALLTASAGVTVSGAALTMSGQNIVMGTNKCTGLAAGTANGDSIRYEQVNQLWGYRRPVLQYSSGTVVNLETGNLGTSGSATILFPDGAVISDSTSGHINCNLAQNSSTGASPQSGLRTGSQTNNTWYAIYAVKANSGANFVTIADTVLPIQANFASLNSNFGANSWVYLGLVRNGDNAGATTVVLQFKQHGNVTILSNACALTSENTTVGFNLANTTGATSVTYTYAAGTGTTSIPNNVLLGQITGNVKTGSVNTQLKDGGDSLFYALTVGTVDITTTSGWADVTAGFLARNGSSVRMNIALTGWIDAALGVGPSPVL